jgi:hypothetical protein
MRCFMTGTIAVRRDRSRILRLVLQGASSVFVELQLLWILHATIRLHHCALRHRDP